MEHGPQIHQVMPKDRVSGEQYERDDEARSEPVVGGDPGEIGDEKVGGGSPDRGEHHPAPEIAELRALLRGGQAPFSGQHDGRDRPGEDEIGAKERIERPGVAHERALDDPWPREQEWGGGRAIGEPDGQAIAGDEHRGRRRGGGDRIVSNQLQEGRGNEAGPGEGDGQPEPEVGARLETADAEDPNGRGQGARRETAVGPRPGRRSQGESGESEQDDDEGGKKDRDQREAPGTHAIPDSRTGPGVTSRRGRVEPGSLRDAAHRVRGAVARGAAERDRVAARRSWPHVGESCASRCMLSPLCPARDWLATLCVAEANVQRIADPSTFPDTAACSPAGAGRPRPRRGWGPPHRLRGGGQCPVRGPALPAHREHRRAGGSGGRTLRGADRGAGHELLEPR